MPRSATVKCDFARLDRDGDRRAGAHRVQQLARERGSHVGSPEVDNRTTVGNVHPPAGHDDDSATRPVDDVGFAVDAVSHE